MIENNFRQNRLKWVDHGLTNPLEPEPRQTGKDGAQEIQQQEQEQDNVFVEEPAAAVSSNSRHFFVVSSACIFVVWLGF